MKNIGLVGLGFIGNTHLKAYQHIDSAKVISICTRSKKSQIRDYDGSFVTEYEELLSNQEIDIIDICLPTYLHEEYIIKAANAGKHIICEKPLTLNTASAKRILHAVQSNKVQLFVGHVLRFWPEYELIKAFSKTEQLKNIEIIHAKRLGIVPTWSDWFQYPEKSGGALFDLHIHDLDFVYHLLGNVETVYAVGHKNEQGAWDHVMTTVTFKNRAKAFIEASQRMPKGYPFTMSLRAQNRTNAIEMNIVAGDNIENINESSNQFLFYENGDKTVLGVKKEDAFQKEVSYFLHCVENDEENTVIPLEDVLYTLKLLEAIQLSLETGHEVHVEF